MAGSARTRTGPEAERLPGALISAGAALGLLVGIRSVVALEPPRLRGLLRLPGIPREELGLVWSTSVRWPHELQDAALDRIATLVGGLLLAAAAVAVFGALLLLYEAGASRRRDLALRAALGASPREIVTLAAGRVRTLGFAACGLGLLLGSAMGAALRALWPGSTTPVGVADALATVLPGLAAVFALLALSYLRSALAIARGAALAPSLLEGGRATAGRGDAARRRVVPALQMGLAGAVAIGTFALVPAGRAGSGSAQEAEEGVSVIAARARGRVSGQRWADTLRRLGAVPGIEAVSLATPGSLLGLGPRASVLAECGDCVRGTLPAPFWAAMTDHHAVAPGYFRDAGLVVAEGRDLASSDGPEAPRVALVNRTFANTAFESGRPIGKRLRLGPGLDDWYTVVGVVEDFSTPVVGGDDITRAAVYVSALQRPPRHADVLLRGTDEGLDTARRALQSSGFDAGVPVPLVSVRRQAAAPLRWAGHVASFLCLVALALALLGARTTALHIARLRTKELAVRRALGAGKRRVLTHVLAGSARSAGWGAALASVGGAALVAGLRKAAGGVPAPGPTVYVAVVGLLVLVSLAAAVRAGREALEIEPAAALD